MKGRQKENIENRIKLSNVIDKEKKWVLFFGMRKIRSRNMGHLD